VTAGSIVSGDFRVRGKSVDGSLEGRADCFRCFGWNGYNAHRLHVFCLAAFLSFARLAGGLKNTWARKGNTLTLADTIVAAIAIERGCALLTDNRKDFPMPGVRLYPLP
jgi:hypothetical protein